MRMCPRPTAAADAFPRCCSKQSDAGRQDVGAITRTLAHHLASLPTVRAHLLALDAADAERVQTDADAAVQLLLVEPLLALAAEGKWATILVDALDEADDETGRNNVVRLLRMLGEGAAAGVSVIVTMRPQPEANVRILENVFGADNVLKLAPADLRAPAVLGLALSAAIPGVHDQAWTAAMSARLDSKIYQVLAGEFARRWTGGPLPPTLARRMFS